MMKEPSTTEELQHEIDLLDVSIAEHESKLSKLQSDKREFESQLEDEDRKVPYRLWKCRYTECDHGMGLAGKDSCPGDPRKVDCGEFTTEYSDYEGEVSGKICRVGDNHKLRVSQISWDAWMDNSGDDIRVGECLDAAIKSLPRSITDKINKIDIRRLTPTAPDSPDF